jgi:transposase
MGYRAVAIEDLKEVLRQWLQGAGKKTIASRVGLDPKTVRRYVEAGQRAGLVRAPDVVEPTEAQLSAIAAAVQPGTGRPRGDVWARCEEHREQIQKLVDEGLRLTKVRKLLRRTGIELPYSTLHRYAVEELKVGEASPSVPLSEGEPGHELQVDTGWVLKLPDERGVQRSVKAWIFTAAVSRHRFVWPIRRETTQSAIEACEAAWEFFGGVFAVLLPDNTKAIVAVPDPLHPRITPLFLEYAQARHFLIDPARVRHPKDKARVERSVPTVRDDCYGGERLRTLEEARERGRDWSLTEYGQTIHRRTQRKPLEHFKDVELPRLRPAPAAHYDVPVWCEPTVGPDHLATVAKAVYTLPSDLIGHTLRARADRTKVVFYEGVDIVKVHPRQPPGGRSIDRNDLPREKVAYALRDGDQLIRDAAEHGEAVCRYTAALLDSPLPWTRLRAVHALLGDCRKYGSARVEEACGTALESGMLDVSRLHRMLERATAAPPPPPQNVIPIGRYLRPASQYALPRPPRQSEGGES